VQPAPQPEVSALTGFPLIQADAAGSSAFLAYNSTNAGPLGAWSASAPNQFNTSITKESAVDLATAADGAIFAVRTKNSIEIRTADLTLTAIPAVPELEQIPTGVLVPGMALHATGALLYQPFLTGPAPTAPPAVGVQGGVDIIDTHTGRLRLRVTLPEPLSALSTDVDSLHGSFLTIDEAGREIFALTTSGLTVLQLADVPLSIGTISPASGPANGGTTLTLRGSGFQSGVSVMLGGKPAATTFIDINTLTLITPTLPSGPQQIVIANQTGDSYSLDAAFTAN
jgi:hypothetical protein